MARLQLLIEGGVFTKFLSDYVTGLEPIVVPCNAVVDYGPPLSELVEDGGFRLADERIVDPNFLKDRKYEGQHDKHGRKMIDMLLIYFGRYVTISEVFEVMVGENSAYPPCTQELLTFGRYYPSLFGQSEVVALGSFAGDDVNAFPVVCKRGKYCVLDLHHLDRRNRRDHKWPPNICFLAVRKSME